MPQTADPTSSFNAVYDAWNIMVGIYDGTPPIAEYKYDGRKFRLVKLTYTGGTLSETRHFYYTAKWQAIEERLDTATVFDRQYICGIRYVDEVVGRDDATPQRLYVCQDASFSPTSIVTSSGGVAERYLYAPHGSRTVMSASWSIVAASVYGWTRGFQALTIDPGAGVVHARLRPFDTNLGSWDGRDAIGYADSSSLYEFLLSNPIIRLDPSGLGGFSSNSGSHARPATPVLPTGNTCQYRVRCHPFAFGKAHCGLEIYNGGVPITLGSAGTPVTSPIVGLDGIGPAGDQMTSWTDVFAFLIDYVLPTSDSGYRPAKIGLHSAYPYNPQNIFGPWTTAPQDVCDCLLNNFNTILLSVANKQTYHAGTTNSNWMLKCYTQHCGLTISWGSIPKPPGFDDYAPCPCALDDLKRKEADWWAQNG